MKLGPNPFGDGHAAERIADALAERAGGDLEPPAATVARRA